MHAVSGFSSNHHEYSFVSYLTLSELLLPVHVWSSLGFVGVYARVTYTNWKRLIIAPQTFFKANKTFTLERLGKFRPERLVIRLLFKMSLWHYPWRKDKGRRWLCMNMKDCSQIFGGFVDFWFQALVFKKIPTKCLQRETFFQLLDSCLWVTEFSCKETKKVLATLVGWSSRYFTRALKKGEAIIEFYVTK